MLEFGSVHLESSILRKRALVLVAISQHRLLEEKKGQEISKDRVKNEKVNNYPGEKRFWMQKRL